MFLVEEYRVIELPDFLLKCYNISQLNVWCNPLLPQLYHQCDQGNTFI